MQKARASAGYTLIEVIVALLIFTVGALALAASSAVVAQSLTMNALRERAGRVALSRIEVIKSQCALAGSGRETVRQIESSWAIARTGSSRMSVTESVSYSSPRGSRTETYRATIWCPG
jgi:prepilin-type N-terminal cleavage/methylation domain-containing protein